MEKEPKMGIDPKIKEEIHKEGFEESAAVLIGKKEEMAQLLEKLEAEGKTADLGTYIKLHKNVVLPNSEAVNEYTKEDLLDNKGTFISLETRGWVGEDDKKLMYVLEYIDKDGNLSQVDILVNDVADLDKKIIESKEYNIDRQKEMIRANLLNLGFKSWYEVCSEEERKQAEKDARKDIDNDSRPGFPLSRVNDAERERRFKERIEERLYYFIREPKLQKILDAKNAYKQKLEEMERSKKEKEIGF